MDKPNVTLQSYLYNVKLKTFIFVFSTGKTIPYIEVSMSEDELIQMIFGDLYAAKIDEEKDEKCK